MRKITLLIIFLIALLSLTNVHAGHGNIHEPTIEKQERKESRNMPHPQFSWDQPGPTSPVLHPGSAKGAGMVEGPLRQIDTELENLIDDGMMPGAVTFVARRGHIVQHEAYGHAFLYEDGTGKEVDKPITMEKDTIFDLASISKIFTTTAAMILYEEGLFELDDPVANYIPEFAENGKENVTIRQLMTHTSGFTAWIPLYTIGENREERLQYVFQYPLANTPGSTYTYSDLNMITLGAIIERLSGKRLDEYVHEKITKPLKMNDTMYNPPASLKYRIAATEYQPWTNRGIVWGEVHDESAWSLDGVAGHAGVFSTANDLGKLAHMFINDGKYGGKRILKPETIKLLVENQIPEFPGNDHGLGWELAQGWYMDALSEASTLGHTGYTGTSLVINLNNDTIAILLTNRVHPSRETVSTNPARRQIARQVADAIPVKMPTKNKDAWFSGYGDRLNRVITAEVSIENEATLAFDTWYRIEQDFDFGIIEVSTGGESWEQVHSKFTGSSVDFQAETVAIPAGTTHIRFRYQTDATTNGRGWYITNLKLADDSNQSLPLNLVSEGWKKRNY
ncbi:serine hydrolase domain-containing protein [Oceanobacillus chungangensis]|uniref:Serine hydrolase n=1 Tax=Oceanobacillus chungangensis TaxID=1229152 RepID=A0A3D8PK61_9BACI|nr:serine hydrolase domain-containing protein [Oceanobacillus chungangensis]RDW15629.1 serine hydrolase [Oceanobacillus chungangensis]